MRKHAVDAPPGAGLSGGSGTRHGCQKLRRWSRAIRSNDIRWTRILKPFRRGNPIAPGQEPHPSRFHQDPSGSRTAANWPLPHRPTPPAAFRSCPARRHASRAGNPRTEPTATLERIGGCMSTAEAQKTPCRTVPARGDCVRSKSCVAAACSHQSLGAAYS